MNIRFLYGKADIQRRDTRMKIMMILQKTGKMDILNLNSAHRLIVCTAVQIIQSA